MTSNSTGEFFARYLRLSFRRYFESGWLNRCEGIEDFVMTGTFMGCLIQCGAFFLATVSVSFKQNYEKLGIGTFMKSPITVGETKKLKSISNYYYKCGISIVECLPTVSSPYPARYIDG